MTILNHTLGFPRVGLRRELKKAQESYWAGNSTREELLAVGRELRARHWDQQKQAGIDLLPVGDFAWYDHVLTTSLLLGNVPARHQNKDGSVDIDTLFRIGRGRAPTGEPAAAAEMTKWFNTNYHYMVPEFVKGQQFKLTWTQLLEEVDEALALGHNVKPVLLGPVTYLWLGKVKGEQFDRLSLPESFLSGPVHQAAAGRHRRHRADDRSRPQPYGHYGRCAVCFCLWHQHRAGPDGRSPHRGRLQGV